MSEAAVQQPATALREAGGMLPAVAVSHVQQPAGHMHVGAANTVAGRSASGKPNTKQGGNRLSDGLVRCS